MDFYFRLSVRSVLAITRAVKGWIEKNPAESGRDAAAAQSLDDPCEAGRLAPTP
jgi:hypothetical protein